MTKQLIAAIVLGLLCCVGGSVLADTATWTRVIKEAGLRGE